MIQQNDAAGGAGSIAGALQAIAVNGLSRAIDGALAKKYPLTSFNETQAVNAQGEVKPRSAPQAGVSATDAAKGLLSNPVVIGSGIAVVVAVLIVLAIRK